MSLSQPPLRHPRPLPLPPQLTPIHLLTRSPPNERRAEPERPIPPMRPPAPLVSNFDEDLLRPPQLLDAMDDLAQTINALFVGCLDIGRPIARNTDAGTARNGHPVILPSTARPSPRPRKTQTTGQLITPKITGSLKTPRPITQESRTAIDSEFEIGTSNLERG
ncbi:hypothetical protein CVT26_011325 [Gymnopilus dilepis]|uniref:Uncharacterized protein n=1 Tax=Gymnopilus dilepis TaxID=231916 RepID=A0A409WWT8_9AGAR|nr:hypothetical protein CVT26_011325 [Gymnopilus dilepis]